MKINQSKSKLFLNKMKINPKLLMNQQKIINKNKNLSKKNCKKNIQKKN